MDVITRVADWRRIEARAVDRWYVGVDLGQSTDPTAICVLNHRVIPLDKWTRNETTRTTRQERTEYFDVRHLERLPLGMSYPQQIQRVADLLARPPLNLLKPKLVIDETGVGRPVGDMFDAAGLRPNRITITAGLEATQHGANTWHVPKGLLISNLEAHSHAGELRIGVAVNDAAALKDELKDFKRKISEAGRTTYTARVGAHDDLVLSVAITLWMATQGPLTIVEPLSLI
ncbi:hypothetical protein [Bradyrhizobium iriomotense]|uniref:Terminase large subunit gp17-like C-terminal domain-containing protein n=1 Tax=Bradyrhizobium iriomotense TaxID=441950 RepID=A0ABQ6BAC4_9BRAD|nr:hypothetical protein [Bradyrhizobium iriomotense]GLR91327.1 hypothetical protein GCM10007857_80440 [Bradyrhizobium iriomotense]